MADGWLVEEGIGEHRAVRLSGERIVAARCWWPGELTAGWVIEARLTSRAGGSARGTAVSANGEDILVSGLPREAREGATIRIEITRASVTAPGRVKRAQGRPSTLPLAMPTLAEALGAAVVRRFPSSEWDEIAADALSGEFAFSGGTLLFAPTPAMTTVDIDGDLPPRALALAAVAPLADALRRFDLGGSVVVDFPTLAAKEDRRAVDAALEAALGDWPHERTAMNGFGLVQIVARLERPSLLHRAAWQRAAFAWRQLLRRAEALDGAGEIALRIHPALALHAAPDQLAALERRTGRTVRVETVASQVLEAPHAQMIPPT